MDVLLYVLVSASDAQRWVCGSHAFCFLIIYFQADLAASLPRFYKEFLESLLALFQDGNLVREVYIAEAYFWIQLDSVCACTLQYVINDYYEK
jgi:hypothetical protein